MKRKNGIVTIFHKIDSNTILNYYMCIHPGCKTQPSYNKEGETIGLYCREHRKDGMVDVKNIRCIHPGCSTRPSFNTERETKGIYCNKHRKDGMMNVVDKSCIHPGCKKQPNYNKDGERPIYCGLHRRWNGKCNKQTVYTSWM